jgi:hypothetical protein
MPPMPGTTGGTSGYFRAPLKTSAAYGATQVASTSTSTSPPPATGSGSSRTASGLPNRVRTAAYTWGLRDRSGLS